MLKALFQRGWRAKETGRELYVFQAAYSDREAGEANIWTQIMLFLGTMKMNFLSPYCALVLCLSSSRLSHADTYYVAKTGSDSGLCSASSPCLSIQKGVSKAVRPGDTVIIRAGTYVESVTNWNSGALGRPITVKANPGDLVVWRGSETAWNSLTGAISIQKCSYIRIEGLRFEGTATRATIRIRGRDRGEDGGYSVVGIEIINNTFTNNGNNGIATDGGGSRVIYLQGTGNDLSYSGGPVNIISKNSFEGNYGADLHLIAGTSDTRIADNTSTHLRSSQAADSGSFFNARFIQLGGGSRRNVIERNTISSISRDSYASEGNRYFAVGIRLDTGAFDNFFSENVIHDIDFAHAGRSAGIYAESRCQNNLFERNIVYNVGEVGLREGSLRTHVAVGNRWINNTVYNCNQSGLVLINAQGSVVKNNLFVNNGVSQIYVGDQSVAHGSHVFKNNDYFSTRSTEIAVWNGSRVQSPPADKNLKQWIEVSGESNALSVDPLFVNPPVDFHLRSGSPARGAGEEGVDLGALSTLSP